jgi:hypothetical protein
MLLRFLFCSFYFITILLYGHGGLWLLAETDLKQFEKQSETLIQQFLLLTNQFLIFAAEFQSR